MNNAFSFAYISDLKDKLDKFPHEQFDAVAKALMIVYDQSKNIFIMGNGGSGSTASHFACDINKGCSYEREKKFRVICLNDNVPTMLAYANDVSYDKVFVEQLKNFLHKEDLVIGISGSGNSENVIQAISYANNQGAETIGLSGFNGGKLSEISHISLVASVHDMQKVEDIHMIIVHMLMQYLCGALTQEGSCGCSS